MYSTSTEAHNGEVLANSPLRASIHHININNQGTAMINFRAIKYNKLRATFKTSDGIEHIKRGRVAQAIAWLCEQQERDITALEMSSWSLWLGAYIHILRHKYSINIRTDDELHEGGRHGRYVLLSPVEIVKIEDLSQ